MSSAIPFHVNRLTDLSDDEIQTCITTANELKEEATSLFRTSEWDQAIEGYRSSLQALIPSVSAGDESDSDNEPSHVPSEPIPETSFKPEREIEKQWIKLRAVLNGNIAACFYKLEKYTDTVKACTTSLDDDPGYIKVIQRREAANEKLDTWSSLVDAQKDVETLIELLPSSSPEVSALQRRLPGLKARVDAAQKKETGEMIGKLKELGNSFLGNFGLSTDNFKFEPNGQGGYSMNMGK